MDFLLHPHEFPDIKMGRAHRIWHVLQGNRFGMEERLDRFSRENSFGGLALKERGVVKWFNGAKGYGFIQRQSGEDVFVHFSAIQVEGYKTLTEGEAVEFECQQGPKGLNALDVTRVGQ